MFKSEGLIATWELVEKTDVRLLSPNAIVAACLSRPYGIEVATVDSNVLLHIFFSIIIRSFNTFDRLSVTDMGVASKKLMSTAMPRYCPGNLLKKTIVRLSLSKSAGLIEITIAKSLL